MVFSYPEVLYRSFGSSITFVLDETHWHRINAKVSSHVFSLLASVEGTTVCLEILLQPPPPPRETVTWQPSPPPPPGRPSCANPGVCKEGAGYLCGVTLHVPSPSPGTHVHVVEQVWCMCRCPGPGRGSSACETGMLVWRLLGGLGLGGGGGGGNYWAPLTRKRHILPHPAQPQHTNHGAPPTRKQHQQEHRPQRLTESSDPTQHAKGRTGDCPGPRKETTTRRHVTQGVHFL